jgi:hypothetical protein
LGPDRLTQDAVTPDLFAATKRNLVIVDPATPDYQVFLDDLSGQRGGTDGIAVYVLKPRNDGVAQISQVLGQFHDLDSVPTSSSWGLLGVGVLDLQPNSPATKMQATARKRARMRTSS